MLKFKIYKLSCNLPKIFGNISFSFVKADPSLYSYIDSTVIHEGNKRILFEFGKNSGKVINVQLYVRLLPSKTPKKSFFCMSYPKA